MKKLIGVIAVLAIAGLGSSAFAATYCGAEIMTDNPLNASTWGSSRGNATNVPAGAGNPVEIRINAAGAGINFINMTVGGGFTQVRSYGISMVELIAEMHPNTTTVTLDGTSWPSVSTELVRVSSGDPVGSIQTYRGWIPNAAGWPGWVGPELKMWFGGVGAPSDGDLVATVYSLRVLEAQNDILDFLECDAGLPAIDAGVYKNHGQYISAVNAAIDSTLTSWGYPDEWVLYWYGLPTVDDLRDGLRGPLVSPRARSN